MTSVLLLHHSDYAGHIDQQFAEGSGMIKRIDLEALEVRVDVPYDDRRTWFFKGLSVPVVNHLLRVISEHSACPFDSDLGEEDLRNHTVPYDDMTFQVGGEELQVVYSIQDVQSSKLRRAMVGPHGIALYEQNAPHFGPILVYRCEKSEIQNDDASITIVTQLLPVMSDIASIRSALCTLNFGG
jgi:hypothetical protein